MSLLCFNMMYSLNEYSMNEARGQFRLANFKYSDSFSVNKVSNMFKNCSTFKSML